MALDSFDPGQAAKRGTGIRHPFLNLAHDSGCLVITSLFGEQDGEQVSGLEEDAIDPQTPAQAGLNFADLGELAHFIQGSAQQKPEISTTGVDPDAGTRGSNSLCFRSTLGKQRNRPAAPMDIFWHAVQTVLDGLAGIIKAMVFDQDLHAGIENLRVSRTRRRGGVEDPIRVFLITLSVPYPGQLNHGR